MWDNSKLQIFFNEFGERINSISLNNGKYLLIGYNKEAVRLQDIELVSYHGMDCIKVHHHQNQGGTEISWDNYLTTEFIEGIDVMDVDSADYRIDPLILK